MNKTLFEINEQWSLCASKSYPEWFTVVIMCLTRGSCVKATWSSGDQHLFTQTVRVSYSNFFSAKRLEVMFSMRVRVLPRLHLWVYIEFIVYLGRSEKQSTYNGTHLLGIVLWSRTGIVSGGKWAMAREL